MGSQKGNNGVFDFWSEIAASEEQQQQQQQQKPSEIAVIYRRRRNERNTDKNEQISLPDKQNRLSLAANKISWNRSLSIRGRTSIVISAGVDCQPPLRQREAQKKPKPPAPRRKNVKPPNYEKEREYFQEVDSFELLEESPSPKNSGTWAMGVQNDSIVLPQFNSRLGKWLVAKKLNYSCGPSASLSNILETPVIPMESISSDASVTSKMKTPESEAQNTEAFNMANEGSEDIGNALQRLSLTQRLSLLDGNQRDSFASLLRVCKQSTPSTLLELFSQYCDPGSIVKIGEGTFGEAFKAGATVCKIVPIDGDLLVNGEVQKRSSELLEEVLLSWTLNSLKGQECHVDNICTSFIETIDVRVCQGSYDAALIKAWEDWDVKHGSENDHPKEFPDKQCYVVFVLAHGGKDLESFVLLNFDEAQSLLVQVVTAALAVAEAAYEFEHRDLHWGNILLTRSGAETVKFILEGRQMLARTFGLSISIIDFTLSRINTGEAIYFLDLSSDPELFKGPKGDKQSETYRKMKEVTEECWEGSFPRTNVLWLQYLVDILLLKKSFSRTPKDEKNLRALKRRLSMCCSAKEAISDPFFSNLLLDHAM
ncbi:Protein kinase domain [Macleaya cordata]|uniref:non-specific serine/threonine protein kinase n=1 Tax=Macleaya cordata TaxID=56857 RepID=A0A200R1R0_MACCD|nr:Protein kinase domain [Macleaya cordata]